MTVFLAHLTGLALGRKKVGAARPALPPRFAATLLAQPGLEEVSAATGTASPRAAQDTPKPLQPPLESPPQIAADTTGTVTQSAVQRLPVHHTTPPAGHDRGRRPAVEKQPVPATPTTAPAAPVLRTQQPQASPAAFQSAQKSGAEKSPLRVMLPAVRSDAAQATARAQPLSEAVVASVHVPRSEVPPIIEVTIDRIDIRAPVGERAASKAAAHRRQPTMTLADYLRGQGAAR